MPAPGPSEAERQLDLVQRLIVSTLVVVVLGGPSAALAAYAPVRARTDHGTGVGLWVMAGVIGLLAALGVLLVNRRRPYAPWLLLGLLPAAVSAWFVFD